MTEIGFAAGSSRISGLDVDAVRRRKRQVVEQVHAVKHRLDVVISVGASFEDAQAKIDLPVGFLLHAVSRRVEGGTFCEEYAKLPKDYSVGGRFL